MGTQQILLIVLSVIIVGVAVSVGIQMFNTQRDSAEIQAIASDLQNIASQLMSYKSTPTSLGGGGDVFLAANQSAAQAWIGWTAATMTNSNATYTLAVTDGQAVVTADNDNASSVTIEDADEDLDDIAVSL